MSRNTIYVTNWSSRGLRGLGKAFTIMALPRSWERGAGWVHRLTPEDKWLHMIRTGRISLAVYRSECLKKFTMYLEAGDLAPGRLSAIVRGANIATILEDGDALCCACSKAKAAAGECHRVWAAEALVRAGWAVILDGKEQ